MLALLLLSLSNGCNDPAYRLIPGDEMDFRIEREHTDPLRVLADGTVAVFLVGSIPVSGLTAAEARIVITERLKEVMRDPKVTVKTLRCAVLVTGAVQRPGRVEWTPTLTLAAALEKAGGATSAKPTAILKYAGQASKLHPKSRRDRQRLIAPGEAIEVR